MLQIQKLHFLVYFFCSHTSYCSLKDTFHSSRPELSPARQPHLANCLQPLGLLLHEVTLSFPRTPVPPFTLFSSCPTCSQWAVSPPPQLMGSTTTLMPLVLTCLLEFVPSNPMHPNGTPHLSPNTMGSTFSVSHSSEWQPPLPSSQARNLA